MRLTQHDPYTFVHNIRSYDYIIRRILQPYLPRLTVTWRSISCSTELVQATETKDNDMLVKPHILPLHHSFPSHLPSAIYAMEHVVDASITLRSRNVSRPKDDVDILAAQLTHALKAAGAGAISGAALKLAVALAEAQTKPSAVGGLSHDNIAISKLPFVQAFQDSFAAKKADAINEQQIASHNAGDRVAAAVRALGHTGYTLIYTPPNVRPTVLDYHHAFKHGMLKPLEVADRVIAFLEKHNKQHHWLSAYSADHIRNQAAASSARYSAGRPLSVFDGVPFVVKDCLDALPYETSYGTKFVGKLHHAKADAPCVTTLRSLGAILLGKAHMPELDTLETTSSATCSSTLNPHNTAKVAGGGSSGCCAAVAAGLCPFALGTEAGGETAVPSSFCGVVSLKPSKGRLADFHAAHGSQSSLTVTTPIANSLADTMLLYAALANVTLPSSEAPKTLSLPEELLPLQERAAINADYILGDSKPLAGLKVGLCKQWVDESTVPVREVMEQTVARMEQLGATIVDVTLPELQEMQAGHLVTYGRELTADAAQQGWLSKTELRSQLSLDKRMFVANALKYTAADYTHAQRIRANVLSSFESVLRDVDVVMTPTTPDVAPAMPAHPDSTGAYDVASGSNMARFTVAASLTGLPALYMPAGRHWGAAFMPIGVQFIGKAWAESTLLRTAAALEQLMLEDGYPRMVAATAVNPAECPIGAHPVAARRVKELWASYVPYHKKKAQEKAAQDKASK